MFTRIEVRDGKIADVGYHPPFDLLFSSSDFEYGDLVGWFGGNGASGYDPRSQRRWSGYPAGWPETGGTFLPGRDPDGPVRAHGARQQAGVHGA
ncbi:MAG: hypothetical protein ACRDZ6_08185 [Acidimicrobiales bacterium]